MGNEDNGQNEGLFCPWMREECSEGKCPSMGELRCRQWSQVITFNAKFGVPKPMGMCVFPAQLLVQGTPRPEMQKLPLGQLKINRQ